MKKYSFYFLAFIAFFSMASCSKDEPVVEVIPEEEPEEVPEIVPELNYEVGSPAYFDPTINFDDESGEAIIKFTSNVPWSASVSETRDGSNWCTVTPSSGEAGLGAIKISVKENTTYDDRNAVIRLAYGETSKSIVVNQKQQDALTLTSDRFEVPVSGGEVTVEVKANIDYKVDIAEDCKDWIHTKPTATRALTASNLTFTVDASQEYDKREGQIEITSGDKKEVVKIYQAGEGILTLTKKEFNLNNSEQDIIIEVKSNFEYSVDMPNVDWVTESTSATRSVSSHTIKLHIKENQTFDDRSATLRIYDKHSDLSESVMIKQGKTPTLQLDQKEFSFDENGGTFTVTSNSNVDYTVQISGNWVSETTSTTTRAVSNKTHTFKVSSMSGTSPREATITFSHSSSNIKETVTVKQKNTFYIDKTSLSLMTDDNATLALTNETQVDVKWESSNNNVATVDNLGNIKAVGRGSATIKVSTTDGKHKAECKVTVKDISDYITAYCSGGSMMTNNGLILYGSSINWYFGNSSSSAVTLISMQLIDGETGAEGNVMSVNAQVAAGESVGYSVRVGLAGIHLPVTCRFVYEYKGKTYSKEAVYKGSNSWM